MQTQNLNRFAIEQSGDLTVPPAALTLALCFNKRPSVSFLPPTDRPQPSALQHEASLHDVLNREHRPRVEPLQLTEQVKRFVFSRITSLR